MVVKDCQRGSIMLEIMLLLMVLIILASQALPAAFKFYRQAAVEYEAEKLLADIRYCQNMSRLTADSAWNYGAKDAGDHAVYLSLRSGYNYLFAGRGDVIARHDYLPGINSSKERDDGSLGSSEYKLIFEADGKPKELVTVLIYYAGYPQEGREIMVSKGGRIRMERGRVGK